MTWIDLAHEDPASWERLAACPEEAPDPLRPRWLRSHLAGAPPEGPSAEPLVTEGTLRRHREAIDPILRLLDDVLAPTLGVFEARDFTLLFADRHGVVVDQRAGGGFADTARRVRLQPGAAWDEPTRGTNAIGTALAEQRAVAVRGAAHFARPHHGLVCYAAPVRDPWGELVGVLDATSFVERADPLAGAAVLSAARALEEALRIATLARADGALVERLLGRLRDPAVLVGVDGRISHANRAALDRGLALGPTYAGGTDVVRARVPVSRVLDVSADSLRAAARGQVRLRGLEVEPVHADGRVVAWLVVLTATPVPPRRRPAGTSPAFAALVGDDPGLVKIRAQAARVAPSTLPVLLLGETGTGKELLARAIHRAGPRAERAFVPVNCAALTPSLLQSELFGYAPGAFTGADTAGRDGRIALADGGTLFLDEVAEMPAALQALLLRFLEDGSYHRVGEATPRRADVRLVCATCRDLPAMVQDGTFRADLFYRIRGVALTLPAVREREDRAALCRALLADLARELGRTRVPRLSPAALERIDGFAWPGKVRELRMALHHALVLAGDEATLEPWHLPPTVAAPGSAQAGPSPEPSARAGAPSMAQAEAHALQRALDAARGNVSAAARALGVARSTVYRMMRKHGLA